MGFVTFVWGKSMHKNLHSNYTYLPPAPLHFFHFIPVHPLFTLALFVFYVYDLTVASYLEIVSSCSDLVYISNGVINGSA